MHVITYSPNFAPPHFTACGIPKKHPTWHNGRSHLLHLCVVCLSLPEGAFFFFSTHKAHTFAQPDIFCKVWKRLGNAVPMGRLLFLPVCLWDVNVPISWCTKFCLKVSCLFPCAVEGGWFVRSYKMKQFTRHTFRTKCNINSHHFLKIGWHHSTRVSDHLHPHLPYVSVIYDGLRTCNFNFFIAFSCFSCAQTITLGIGICGK